MHHIIIPALTVAVYALRRVAKRLPAKYLPWVSALGGLVCAVVTGDANVRSAVEGAVEGLAASGLWSAAGRHLLTAGSGPASGEAAVAEVK